MATWLTQKTGSTGENVRTVQYLLNAHGASLFIDGDFGAATKAAVKSFQQAHGLEPDGIVGNQTWPQLVVTVGDGDDGPAVEAVQSQVNLRLPGRLVVDGLFGPLTTEHVEGFQSPLNLTADGIVGSQTWNRFVNRYLVATSSERAAKRVYDAWKGDEAANARRHATKPAVTELFATDWTPGTWSFAGTDGAAGTMFVSWDKSGGGQLVMAVNNNTGAPYYWVKDVSFS